MMTILWAIANHSWMIAASASIGLNLILFLMWAKESLRKQHLIKLQHKVKANHEQVISEYNKVSDLAARALKSQDVQLHILKQMIIHLDKDVATKFGIIESGVKDGWIHCVVVPFPRKKK
jgi:Zn-dependent protease with chaperone function